MILILTRDLCLKFASKKITLEEGNKKIALLRFLSSEMKPDFT